MGCVMDEYDSGITVLGIHSDEIQILKGEMTKRDFKSVRGLMKYLNWLETTAAQRILKMILIDTDPQFPKGEL